MPRALRKWIARSPGRPADCVVWLGSKVVDRSPGQEAMALGCHTVWNEIAPHLRNRGVTVLEMH